MEMPRPTEHHQRLAAFAGHWSGDEILYPSPWAPEQREATGHFAAEMGVDGMFLVSDYREERDGEVVFRGHGVYGYDRRRDAYTMYWFDSMGGSPAETLGHWDGDTLTFENRGEQGHARYQYQVTGPDSYTFRILASRDGDSWSPMMEGHYRRV